VVNRAQNDGKRDMSRARKKRGTSLFRRLTYLLVIISGGGAGLGSWVFQDDPKLLALWTLVTGKPADVDKTQLDGSLVTEVVDALKPRDAFHQPGVYQVTIAQVQLDQKLFKPGHTVNIQARVKRLDQGGRDMTLWDAKTYGERLAVDGRTGRFKSNGIQGINSFSKSMTPRRASSPHPQDSHSPRPIPRQTSFPSSRVIFPSNPSLSPIRRSTRARTTSSSRASTSAILDREIQAQPRSPSARSSSSEPNRAKGASDVSIRLSLDRFEGDNKEIAVLVNDEGEIVNLPKSLLPPGTKPGDVLTLTLERDAVAGRRVAKETRRVQDKLSERDPGGDIKL
jgi:hypothetical protein